MMEMPVGTSRFSSGSRRKERAGGFFLNGGLRGLDRKKFGEMEV